MPFWDTSAIVPLCINEDRSHMARRLWREFPERAVWRETPVEVASTFARLAREKIIDDSLRTKAEKRFAYIEKEWKVVESAERLIELARTFPSVYGLRALDSLQLAAALVWCKEFPKDKDFISADVKLLQIAGDVGFTVHDLS